MQSRYENFIPSIPLSLRYIYHHSWKDALIMTCELQSWQKDIRTIYLHPLGHSFFFPAWFNSPHSFEILCFGCTPSPITTLYLLENVLKVHHSSRKSLRLCSELAVKRTIIDSYPWSQITFHANQGEKKSEYHSSHGGGSLVASLIRLPPLRQILLLVRTFKR